MSGLLLVGAGPPSRDGGVDLFLELMAVLADRADVGFAWLGGRPRSVARRLDAETATLGMSGRVDWRPHGDSLSGPGVVHVITARTVAAASLALREATDGAPVIGLASDDDVRSTLESAGVLTVRYPDLWGLAELALDPDRKPNSP
jgi:hypothetical protein